MSINFFITHIAFCLYEFYKIFLYLRTALAMELTIFITFQSGRKCYIFRAFFVVLNFRDFAFLLSEADPFEVRLMYKRRY